MPPPLLAPERPNQLITSEIGIKVAMRDGTRLSTDVYRPRDQNQIPVILIRTPYNKNDESEVDTAVYFASRGYAVVIQDVRGRYDSGGEWEPFINVPINKTQE